MRIKDVCERTGLTRRAIRFYAEKRLITPEIDPKEHNDYRDYSEEDVQRLCLIARLRALRLSVEDVSQILKEPSRSGMIFKRHQETLDKEGVEVSEILDILSKVGGTDSLSVLSDRLDRAESSALSPDAEPDFRQFENLTDEERRQFSDGGAVIDRIHREKWKKGLLCAFIAAVVLIVGAIFGVHIWWENQLLGLSSIVGTTVQLLELQAGEIGGEYHFYAVVKFECPPDCVESDTLHLPLDTKRNTGGMIDALVPGTIYSGMNIRCSVPRKVAGEYGLLTEKGYLDAEKTLGLFFTDKVFAREYGRINRFYAGTQISPLDKVFAQDRVN